MTLLKTALQAKRIKQCELAKAIKQDPARVSRMVCGWVHPGRETKIKIAKFLKMPMHKLFEE